MGQFATPLWGQAAGLACAATLIIVGLNGKLVLDQVGEWSGSSVIEQQPYRAGSGVQLAWRGWDYLRHGWAQRFCCSRLGDNQAVRASVRARGCRSRP